MTHRTETVVLTPGEHKAMPSAVELRNSAEPPALALVKMYVRKRGPATIALDKARLWSRPASEIVAILKGEQSIPEGWGK